MVRMVDIICAFVEWIPEIVWRHYPFFFIVLPVSHRNAAMDEESVTGTAACWLHRRRLKYRNMDPRARNGSSTRLSDRSLLLIVLAVMDKSASNANVALIIFVLHLIFIFFGCKVRQLWFKIVYFYCANVASNNNESCVRARYGARRLVEFKRIFSRPKSFCQIKSPKGSQSFFGVAVAGGVAWLAGKLWRGVRSPLIVFAESFFETSLHRWWRRGDLQVILGHYPYFFHD